MDSSEEMYEAEQQVEAMLQSEQKRKKPHKLETNPITRRRARTMLLRKLRAQIDELVVRTGQQAVVLVAMPNCPKETCKVFGAQPLADVIQNLSTIVTDKLEVALKLEEPPVQHDPDLFELPPLVFDGIQTPVENLTQAQLRAFIPVLMKYSTGRGKPGWGDATKRPPWWPSDLPWANVRMDVRSAEEKKKMPWTAALRRIVFNCYNYHGRQDLLPKNEDEDKNKNVTENVTTKAVTESSTLPAGTCTIVEIEPINSAMTLANGSIAHVQDMFTVQREQNEAQADATVPRMQNLIEDGVVDANSITDVTANPYQGQAIFSEWTGFGSNITTTPQATNYMDQTMMANVQYMGMNKDGILYFPNVEQVLMEPKRKLTSSGDNMQTTGDLTANTNRIIISGTDGLNCMHLMSLEEAMKLKDIMEGNNNIKEEETTPGDK